MIFCAVLPPFAYWFYVGRVPTILSADAQEILLKKDSSAVLVDVRDSASYNAEHIEGAENWQLEQINQIKSTNEIPQKFSSKKLLCICNSGFLSAFAVEKLKQIGAKDVFSVDGGMQKWLITNYKPCFLQFLCLKKNKTSISEFHFKESTVFEQYAVFISAFIIKPIYMLLSLLAIFMLRKTKAIDLLALRWAMISFFVGEAFCAINYLIFNDDSYLSEFIHSFGMVLSFVFVSYAFIEGFDSRIIRFSDTSKRCAMLTICKSCYKHSPIECNLHKMFKFLVPVFILLATMPLLFDTLPISYNTIVFDTPYSFSHLTAYQIYEFRVLPFTAIAFFLATMLFIFTNRVTDDKTKILFSLGFGFLGFSIFRLFIFGVYQTNLVWFTVWEEVTELMYIAMVLVFLIYFNVRENRATS